jgi:hypothetical protein
VSATAWQWQGSVLKHQPKVIAWMRELFNEFGGRKCFTRTWPEKGNSIIKSKIHKSWRFSKRGNKRANENGGSPVGSGLATVYPLQQLFRCSHHLLRLRDWQFWIQRFSV